MNNKTYMCLFLLNLFLIATLCYDVYKIRKIIWDIYLQGEHHSSYDYKER
jgi:hypothetical protein